ncbi:MAG: tripartite tricarboxylate transporter TctB family protein [Synergistaceae bacterium]
MKIKKLDDLSVSLIFLLVGIIYASQIPKIQVTKITPIDGRFLPVIFVSGIILFSAINFFRNIDFKAVGNTAKTEEAAASGMGKDYICVGLTLVLSLCYVLFLESLGFVVNSALYIFAQGMLFAPKADRKPLFLFGVSIAASLVIYFVFRGALNLMLPNGILTEYF